MKKHWLTIALFILASAGCEQRNSSSADSQALEPTAGYATESPPPDGANAARIQDSVLASAVEDKFPDSVILAHSAECRSNIGGPIQTGLILQQRNELHAVIAVSSQNTWAITNLPRRVEYSGGAMANFLDEFESAEARKQLEVRCINPNSDADISIEANGAFMAHRGEQNTARHLCFPASAVPNSWVCYWTNPGATRPELSFVQFNGD